MGKGIHRGLRLQLFSSFVLLSALILLATAVGYLFIYKAEKKLTEFSKLTLQQLLFSYTIADSFANTQSNLRELLLENNTNRTDEINHAKIEINNQQVLLKSILFDWKKIQKASLENTPPKNQAELNKYKNLRLLEAEVDQYFSLVKDFITAYEAKKLKIVDDIFEKQLEPLHRKMIKDINEFKSQAEMNTLQALNDVRIEIFLSTLISFCLVFSIIAVGMLSAYRLSKSIIGQLIQPLEKIKEGKSKLIHMARHDLLTELPNRLLFNEELDRVISKAERHKEIFALLMIDIDQFKSINDTYGHQVGDLFLKQVAERQKGCLRTESIVARFGGDEFAIILTDLKTPQDAGVVAQNLIKELSKPYLIGEEKIKSSVSIGIANYPISAKNAVALIQSADIALYHAKNAGRNNYQFFTSAIGNQHQEKITLENYLRDAIEKNQMTMVYQPVFSANDGKIVGMEALLRWTHPKLGSISPEIFIPLAEERGMIIDIGTWVLSQACYEFAKMCSAPGCEYKLFLNVSPYQLIPDFIELLIEILAKTGLRPKQLEIEITETSIMASLIGSEKVLAAIQALGVKIAIDDFGTGYSSLARLKSLPINTLKIDRSFIQYVNENLNDRAIILSILGLAKSFNMDVVAEGVETKKQMDFLIENGCDSIQGFYLSKPLTMVEMQNLIESNTIGATKF